MKLYGADLLLLASCVRAIKAQGLEFEAAEDNLSELEVPNHDKMSSASDFWHDSTTDPSETTQDPYQITSLDSIADKRQLNDASDDLYWGAENYFCGARGTEIKCVGEVFCAGTYVTTKEPTELGDIYGSRILSSGDPWYQVYTSGNPNPWWDSPYTTDIAAPFQKVIAGGPCFLILDAEGKLYQFPRETGGFYIEHVHWHNKVTSEQRFSDIMSGNYGFCAVPTNGGDLICWGTGARRPSSDIVSASKLISQHTTYCAVYKDDEVSATFRYQPEFVKQDVKTALGKTNTSIIQVGGNEYNHWLLFSDGTVACLGRGFICGLGYSDSYSEFKMVPELQNVSVIKSLYHDTVAIVGGSLVGYGGPPIGKFGDPDRTSGAIEHPQDISYLVPAGETAVDIYQSKQCVYILCASGNLYFFGNNKHYGSGDPSLDSSATIAAGQTKLVDMNFSVPTQSPSNIPSLSPSDTPSVSMSPSNYASDQPSNEPSSSLEPSNPPSHYPTVSSKPSSRPVIVNPCATQNCNNAGKCEALSSKEFKCRCETTFINSANGRTCVCPPGFVRKSDNRCYDPNTPSPIAITSSPTVSPNVSNTSAPTTSPNVSDTPAPTSSPSQTVADEEDECTDDENAKFYLNNDHDKHVKCSWLTANKARTGKRIANYCDLPRVKTLCKSTCSFCTCVDDESFTFDLINVTDPKRKTQHCDWLTANKKNHEIRLARYCTEDYESGAVMNACTKSCGLCE